MSQPKDKKTRLLVDSLDRSSSLVWMTHSHCVREEILSKGRGFKSHSVHHYSNFIKSEFKKMRSAFKTVDTSKTSRILVNNEQNNEK